MNAPTDSAAQAGAPLPLARRGWNLRLQMRLARKELRETLRDRRTIITLVLMPLLVYPLLSVAFQKLLLASLSPTTSSTWAVGVESDVEYNMLLDYLAEGEVILHQRQAEPSATQGESKPPDAGMPQIDWRKVENAKTAVAELGIDVGVRVRLLESPDPRQAPPIECILLYRPDSPNSESAVEYLESRLRAVNEEYVRSVFQRLRIPPAMPIVARQSPVESEMGAPVSIATLVPLVLILMTITGAVYPAIDLTAGERERGTLETLVAAPAPRMSLLLAKYAAVVIVAMMTATINLAAMMTTVFSAGLGPLVFGDNGLTPGLVAQVFGLLCIFAMFFSAILLAITSFARSFKEAQAYLIPLMLLSLAPGFLSLMPGLELSPLLAVTPLVNIVLLSRDVLQGHVHALYSILTIVSTALYAFAAIAVAARIFGTDAVLYGAEGGWTELFSRPRQASARPSVTNAAFCLAMLFPLFIVLSGQLALLRDASVQTRLWCSAAITVLVFGGVPLAAAAYSRVRIAAGFQLRAAPPLAFAAALLLGLACWPIAHEIVVLGQELGAVQLNSQLLENAQKFVAELRSQPLLVALLTIAVAPPVFEELFFRGYLLGAFQPRMGRWSAIWLTAALFGAFHVIVSNSPVIRFFPTTFMGVVLGWVCVRSGSVLPGMLLHVCHNGLLISIAYFQTDLEQLQIGVEQTEHLPAAWILAAVAATAVGVGLTILATRGRAEANARNIAGQQESDAAALP